MAKSVVDPDAARELAYLLFSIAEKRGWADIALLFNGLGTSWSDLTDASRRLPQAAAVQDSFMFGSEEE
jgi:putative DNA methylase